MNRSRQHGTALVISMIILLVTTMVILQGARSANLELLVGNNSQAAAEALMLAEDSAIIGETMIELRYGGAPTTDYAVSSDDGVFIMGQIDVLSVDWDSMQFAPERVSSTETYEQSLEQGESSPGGTYREFYVEYIGPSPSTGGSVSVGAGAASDTRYIYRISGRGTAGIGGARVIQTIYATAE
jgi:hypothetical protein